MWLHARVLKNIDINPLNYGYKLDEDDNLVPIVSTKPPVPSNFPAPCNCKKCSKPKVCMCRLMDIPCCQYCNCDAGPECKNPLK